MKNKDIDRSDITLKIQEILVRNCPICKKKTNDGYTKDIVNIQKELNYELFGHKKNKIKQIINLAECEYSIQGQAKIVSGKENPDNQNLQRNKIKDKIKNITKEITNRYNKIKEIKDTLGGKGEIKRKS